MQFMTQVMYNFRVVKPKKKIKKYGVVTETVWEGLKGKWQD